MTRFAMSSMLMNQQCISDKVSLFFFNFLIFLKTGFHHVGQAGLELPTSSDLLALASQSARITAVSCHAQLKFTLTVQTG